MNKIERILKELNDEFRPLYSQYRLLYTTLEKYPLSPLNYKNSDEFIQLEKEVKDAALSLYPLFNFVISHHLISVSAIQDINHLFDNEVKIGCQNFIKNLTKEQDGRDTEVS